MEELDRMQKEGCAGMQSFNSGIKYQREVLVLFEKGKEKEKSFVFDAS